MPYRPTLPYRAYNIGGCLGAGFHCIFITNTMTLYDVYGECLQLTNMTTAMAAAATRGHGTIQVVIHNGGSGDHEDHKDVFYHNKGGGDREGNEGNE